MTIGLRHASFGLPSTAFNAPFKSPGVIQPSHTVWKSSVSQKSKQRVFLHVRKITRHSYPVALALLTQALQKVTFHAGETAVTVPLSNEAAVELHNSINNLLQTFQKKAAAAKPQRWESLEFQHSAEDGLNVELFCNPNAYSNAFQAKVLMTVGDGKIKVISEGLLSAIKSDIDQFVEGLPE